MAERTNPHADIVVGAKDEASAKFAQIGQNAQKMGDSVERGAAKAGDAVGKVGDKAQPAAQKVDGATRSIIGSIERATAALKAGEKGTASYFEALAKQRDIPSDLLVPYINQLRQAEAAQKALAAGQKNLGMSAAATAAAMRSVPAQFTDIIVSLQAGQAPMTVLLQQGGQLKDMFGGVGNAAKALGSYVLGLVNSYTLAAAAGAAAFLVYDNGQQSVRALNAALLESNGRIGYTASQLQGMADALASTGFTRNTAATALAAVAANAVVAKTDLQGFTQVALDLEKYAGRSLETTTDQLKKLTEEPSKTAAAMNLLTTAQFEQAKAMEKAGDMAGAAKVALTAYGDEAARVITGYKGDLSKLDVALDFYTRKGREMWNALTGSTIGDSAQQRIGKLKARLAEIDGPLPFQNASFSDRVAGMFDSEGTRARMRAETKGQLDYLEFVEKAREADAKRGAERKRIEQEGVAAFDAVSKAQEKGLTKQQQLTNALKEYDRNLERVRLANPDSAALKPEAVARGRAALRKQYEDKDGSSALNDSLTAQLQLYKNNDKAILDERKAFFDKLVLDAQLGVKGEFETLDARAAKEDEIWAKRKANFEAELEQASKKKNSATEVARITGQMQDAERDYLQNSTKLQNEAALAAERYMKSLDDRIKKQQEAARLAGEQVATAQLEGKAIGLVGDALREQNKALAENRLEGLKRKAKDSAIESRELADAYLLEAENLRKLNEEQNRNRAAQLAFDYTNGIKESNQLLQAEIGLMGLSSRERNIALEQLKIRLDLEKKINALKALEPDSEKRQAEIAAMETAAATAQADAANRVMLDEWKQSVQQYDDIFRQGFADMMNNGKDGWSSFTKSLTTTFKTAVADKIYKMFVQPIVIRLVGSFLGIEGLGGGGGAVGTASSAMSLANLGTSIGSFFGSIGPAWDLLTSPGMGALDIGGIGGGAAGAAIPLGLAALGYFGASYFDKGDTFSGAAYASSKGNDRTPQVIGGALNPDMTTGDLPDRQVIIGKLKGYGAKDRDLEGLNDRQLHRLMILADSEAGMERAGGPMMNWSSWADANRNLPDFYKGPGYAFPEDLGWWEVQDQGSNARYRSMDSMFVDPRVVEASRKLSQGILEPYDKLSQQLGLEADYRVATGMAYNDKTGKIFGGLSIRSGDQELINWGKREFDNKDQYAQALFTDSLEGLEGLKGMSEWAKKQSDDAQKAIAELKGENIGEEAEKIFAGATTSISQTYAQIERLIDIIPDFGNASQDAVKSITDAFGGIDGFSSAYGSFVQNFWKPEERTAYVRKNINASLSDYGISVDEKTTREDYKRLAEAQDLTTEKGRAAYAALIKAGDAFASITPEATAMADLLKQQNELQAEWLMVTGDVAGAEKLRRDEAIKGMTDAEVAQYDSNVALQKRIEKEKEFQQVVGGIGSSLTGVLTDGLLGNLSGADLGGKMADVVIGGVYNALAGGFANQITDLMIGSVVSPLIQAAMTGASVSDAVSQAAINNMVASAQAAASALNAVLSSPEFQEAIKGIDAAIRSISVSMPTTPYYNSYANQQRQQQQSQSAAAKAAADAVKDAQDAAYNALQRAIDAEKERVQTALEAARTLEQETKGLFDFLHGQVRDLFGEVDDTAAMQADQGRAFVEEALAAFRATGALPEQDGLSEAVDAIRRQFDENLYASATDRDFAKLVLAGQLDALRGGAESQLSDAEQQVSLLEAQIEQLDATLKTAKDQLDVLRGIDNSVLSVAAAIAKWNGQVGNKAGGPLSYSPSASFDVGTNYVPYDMTARIHKGERIIPAADNAALLSMLSRTTSGDNSAAVVSELKALREDNRVQAAKIVQLQSQIARMLDKWDGDGLPKQQEEVAA